MLLDRPLGYPSADDAFGPTLRAARERAGITQGELANEMRLRSFEFHQATIYKIETGKRKVSVGEAIALSELVGVPLETLAARDPNSIRSLQFTAKSTAEELATTLPVLAEMANDALRLQSGLRAIVQRIDEVVGDDLQEFGGVRQTAAEHYAELLRFEGMAWYKEGYDQLAGSHEGHAILYEFDAVEPWEDDE